MPYTNWNCHEKEEKRFAKHGAGPGPQEFSIDNWQGCRLVFAGFLFRQTVYRKKDIAVRSRELREQWYLRALQFQPKLRIAASVELQVGGQ